MREAGRGQGSKHSLWTQHKSLCGDVEKGRKNQRLDGTRGAEMACDKVSQTTGRDDAMSTHGTMPVPQDQL